MQNDLRLVAYVPNLPESVRKYCAQREGRFQYFRQGFVSLDLGRHVHYSDAINAEIEATIASGEKAFALADRAGVVRRRYSTIKAAEEARAAYAAIAVPPEPEPEPEPEQSSTPAPTSPEATTAQVRGSQLA